MIKYIYISVFVFFLGDDVLATISLSFDCLLILILVSKNPFFDSYLSDFSLC